MTPEERTFLKDFFRNVTDQPLDPDDPRYVPLYNNPALAEDDPVELMARAIEWTPGESVQLLSGFRGTGKSTELRRLRRRLRDSGYLVVLCDAEGYLNMSTPVDVSDFLMAVAGAFGDALVSEALLDRDPSDEGYWTRFASFLQKTRIEVTELTGGITAVGQFNLKANLKSDPTFRRRLQERMAGHLGGLVADIQSFLEDCVKQLKKRYGDDTEIVLLLDSVEHIRGTFVNAAEVQASVETLFATHADKLHLPYLHVIYTVPPYLKVRYANLGALYAPGGVQVLPALKIRSDLDRSQVSQAGLDALERVVKARGDWRRLLGHRELLDRVSLHSGGHLRDLLRILAEILRRADRVPVQESSIDAGISQVRTEFLPIAEADAMWLARVAKTHHASLEDVSRLPDLARFFDTHLVLCYKNRPEWYDVHPLVFEHVKELAAEVEARRGAIVSSPWSEPRSA